MSGEREEAFGAVGFSVLALQARSMPDRGSLSGLLWSFTYPAFASVGMARAKKRPCRRRAPRFQPAGLGRDWFSRRGCPTT